MPWLTELGYKHCFYLGGGNCMHLVDSANKFFRTTPVVHEVSAGIAAEYYSDLGHSKNCEASKLQSRDANKNYCLIDEKSLCKLLFPCLVLVSVFAAQAIPFLSH